MSYLSFFLNFCSFFSFLLKSTIFLLFISSQSPFYAPYCVPTSSNAHLLLVPGPVGPDLLLGLLGVVLRVLDLVGVSAPVGGEVHAGVALLHQVDAQVGVVHEKVADEVAGLVHVLHLDLHLALQQHLLHVSSALIPMGVPLDSGVNILQNIQEKKTFWYENAE